MYNLIEKRVCFQGEITSCLDEYDLECFTVLHYEEKDTANETLQRHIFKSECFFKHKATRSEHCDMFQYELFLPK